MLKYLAILGVFLGFAFIVASHDENAGLRSAQEAADKNNPALSGKLDENRSQEHQEDVAWDSPAGHIFHDAFHWPDGITVWAILLTLLAIAEQTSQTRKAAEATQVQAEISRKAFISQFRPKVIARAIWLLDKTHGHLGIEIWLTNAGHSAAHIGTSDIKIGWEVSSEPSKKKTAASATFKQVSLPPGGDCQTLIDISDFRVPFEVGRIAVEEEGRPQGSWIHCVGYVNYTDDNGASRSTGFYRTYDMQRKRFIPSDDPETEYTD